jgi:hypothetical protein
MQKASDEIAWLGQAEQREDEGDYYDETDQIDDAVHDDLLSLAGHRRRRSPVTIARPGSFRLGLARRPVGLA